MFLFSRNDDKRVSRMNSVVVLGTWLWRVGIVLAAAFAIAGLLKPMGGRGIPGWQSIERSLTRAVVMCVEAFLAEYARLPLTDPEQRQGEDVRVESRGRWIQALLAKDAEINPKAIHFFQDMPTAKNGHGGLWVESENAALVDTWGNPYAVVFDTDGDRQIFNPEFKVGTESELVPEKLEGTVILYSGGPDANLETWEDNIRSWRFR